LIVERGTGGTSWTVAATRPKFLRRCTDDAVYVKRLNVERLSEERLREAERELEVAEAFLADGL
jgi:hypothetical protein